MGHSGPPFKPADQPTLGSAASEFAVVSGIILSLLTRYGLGFRE